MDDSASGRLIQRYVSVWNTGDLGLIDDICTLDFVVYYPGEPKGIHGRGAAKKLIGAVRTIIPDLDLRVDEEIFAGDKVVLRWTAVGTQKGRWNPKIPATERRVAWSGISIYRIVEGHIAEERVEEDLLGLQKQIGVVVAAPSTQS